MGHGKAEFVLIARQQRPVHFALFLHLQQRIRFAVLWDPDEQKHLNPARFSWRPTGTAAAWISGAHLIFPFCFGLVFALFSDFKLLHVVLLRYLLCRHAQEIFDNLGKEDRASTQDQP